MKDELGGKKEITEIVLLSAANKKKNKKHRVNKSTLWVRFLSHCAKIVTWLFQKHPLRWLQKLMRNSLWRFLLPSYLFASLIIFSVDGHQLCVLSVLVTTGAADSIYHHLNKYKEFHVNILLFQFARACRKKQKSQFLKSRFGAMLIPFAFNVGFVSVPTCKLKQCQYLCVCASLYVTQCGRPDALMSPGHGHVLPTVCKLVTIQTNFNNWICIWGLCTRVRLCCICHSI